PVGHVQAGEIRVNARGGMTFPGEGNERAPGAAGSLGDRSRRAPVPPPPVPRPLAPAVIQGVEVLRAYSAGVRGPRDRPQGGKEGDWTGRIAAEQPGPP